MCAQSQYWQAFQTAITNSKTLFLFCLLFFYYVCFSFCPRVCDIGMMLFKRRAMTHVLIYPFSGSCISPVKFIAQHKMHLLDLELTRMLLLIQSVVYVLAELCVIRLYGWRELCHALFGKVRRHQRLCQNVRRVMYKSRCAWPADQISAIADCAPLSCL